MHLIDRNKNILHTGIYWLKSIWYNIILLSYKWPVYREKDCIVCKLINYENINHIINNNIKSVYGILFITI